jgi:predicted phage baseplate assembly protein
MNRLAPNLFDRRFDDLVAIGRSRLPSLAPEWTDYNAHDPGMTLMDLLAWVAEAQIYSLARTRRDERTAYAALMGLASNGTRPARGLIWPDPEDPNSPAAMISRAFIIERDAAVHTSKSETPTFRPAHRILWIPASIRALTAHLADGSLIEHGGTNKRGGAAFQPFGETAGRNDTLWMELESTGDAPLIPAERPDDARLVIGIRADAARGSGSDEEDRAAAMRRSPLEVMLTSGSERLPLKVVEDTSGGFMRTGVCVLDLSGIRLASKAIRLEFRAPRGFDRPPRVLRIEPNVVPVSQGLQVEREIHIGQGLPNQSFDLATPGLAFEPGTKPVKVEIGDSGGIAEWRQCDLLSDRGPNDYVYELDPVAARISFGNGINGQMPAAGAQIFASYPVSDGTGGNTARNRKWFVQGVGGAFGINPDPVTGGENPSSGMEQCRAARRSLQEGHALVSSADIEAAALALPNLEVSRAWVVPPQARAIETATVTLIAMQARAGGIEPAAIPETPRWLEAVRRRLAPRMPLGSRFVVAAPRYVEFSIRVRAEPEPGRDPAAVKKAIEGELRRRLTLVSERPAMPQRAFGLAVAHRDFTAWLQALPDVRRVLSLQILLDGSKAANEVTLPRYGLPRIDIAASTIEVVRAATGGAR